MRETVRNGKNARVRLRGQGVMELRVEVAATQGDCPFGGSQILPCVCGEFILEDIFRLHFFRIIIDDIIEDNVCFRLMEGSAPHYFVLNKAEPQVSWERQTPIGEEFFTFTLQ